MMKKSAFLSNRRQVFIAVALTAITGVCVAATTQQVPEVAVRERATQRWQALIKGKYQDAYNLLAPGVRAIQSYKAYSTSIGTSVAWTGAEVVRVDCNEAQDNCLVVVRVESSALLPGMSLSRPQTISTHIEETWIRQDGGWWLFPKP